MNKRNVVMTIAIIFFIINLNFLFFEPRTFNLFWFYVFFIRRITPIVSALLLILLKSKSRFFWASLLLFIQFLIELIYFQPWNIPDFDNLYFLLQYIMFPVWLAGSSFYLFLTIQPHHFIKIKQYLILIAVIVNILIFVLESINFFYLDSPIEQIINGIFFNVLPLTLLRTGLFIPIAVHYQYDFQSRESHPKIKHKSKTKT